MSILSGLNLDRPQCELGLHGIDVALSSELPAFVDYVRIAMEPQLGAQIASEVGSETCSETGSETGSEQGGFSVRAHLQWVEGPAPRSLPEAFGTSEWDRRPDRDLYISGDTAYWLRIDDFPDLQLALRWDGSTFEVLGRYYFTLARSRGMDKFQRLRFARDLPRLRARRFSTLLYYLVYHPILWLLSRERGWHALHGGAVADEGRALVLAGMPGCGKSTLAVTMLGRPGWSMLSDNIVLYNAYRVLALPEVLLLDARSRERAGAGMAGLTATGERRVFERAMHSVRRNAGSSRRYRRRSSTWSGGAATFDRRAGTGSRGATLGGGQHAGEGSAPRGDQLGGARHPDRRVGPPDAAGDLAELLSRTPCFGLTVAQGANSEDVLRDFYRSGPRGPHNPVSRPYSE